MFTHALIGTFACSSIIKDAGSCVPFLASRDPTSVFPPKKPNVKNIRCVNETVVFQVTVPCGSYDITGIQEDNIGTLSNLHLLSYKTCDQQKVTSCSNRVLGKDDVYEATIRIEKRITEVKFEVTKKNNNGNLQAIQYSFQVKEFSLFFALLQDPVVLMSFAIPTVIGVISIILNVVLAFPIVKGWWKARNTNSGKTNENENGLKV